MNEILENTLRIFKPEPLMWGSCTMLGWILWNYAVHKVRKWSGGLRE